MVAMPEPQRQVIGVDIGGTGLKLGRVDSQGQLLAERVCPTPQPPSPGAITTAVVEEIAASSSSSGGICGGSWGGGLRSMAPPGLTPIRSFFTDAFHRRKPTGRGWGQPTFRAIAFAVCSP